MSSENQRKYFGTDGIRGTVGDEILDPQFVEALGRAIGTVFNDEKQILIARDTRISGDMLQSAFSAGVCSAGISVCDLGILPTPACAYITAKLQAQAGVVISASHNPYHDNGFKFFTANGSKLSDQQELTIENILSTSHKQHNKPNKTGQITVDLGLADLYIEYCLNIAKSVNNNKSLADLKKLKVVVDCSNGAMYRVAPQVLAELGLNLTIINHKPDGYNINRDCGAASKQGLVQLANVVRENHADLGVAFDGDGDRLILVDANGEIVDGDQILYILACEKLRSEQELPGLVGTLMSNLGLEKAMQDKGITFIRSKVGDRYVLEQLLEKKWYLGGEASGHILSLDKSSTGDGLVTALLIISIMAKTEQSLHELVKDFYKYPQVLVNVRLNNNLDSDYVLSKPIVKSAILDVESKLQGRGRLLVRKSGTEPLIRIMVEAEQLHEVETLANGLADLVREQGGS